MEIVRILIVEDNVISARVTRKRLEGLGYYISSVVSTGEEALSEIEKDSPDLVLMDILLGGEIDGIQAADRIRLKFGIPVVYLTAYVDDEILERAKITEPFGYIIKPFNDRELHSAVKMAIYKNKMEKRIKEREEWFYTTLNSIGDGVITTDKKGCITFINPIVEKVTGMKLEDASGKDFADILALIHEGRANASEIFAKCMAQNSINQAINHIEVEIKGYGTVSFDIKSAPIIDNFGNTTGTVWTFHDVTALRKVQEALEKSFFNLAEAISHAFEYRDPYTAGHQRRVAELAKLVGHELGLPQKRLDELFIGGLLHDIGKISIPIEILAKSSKLSNIEFQLIKEHPQKGCEIMENIKLPWDIRDIILHHHERLDGSGYPEGIHGDGISQNVSIITVCDVVESMSTFRPYRPANSKIEVLNELQRFKGIRYDSEVVEVMLSILESGAFNPW